MLILTAAICAAFAACSTVGEIPTEFPTPELPAAATPVPKLELKRDAELERALEAIARDAKGRVGAAAVVLETGEAALLNADQRFAMQSVYKLPIAMAVMDQVRLGEVGLDEKIAVTRDDFVRAGQASALRDRYPAGGEFTIRELIRLSLVESDGTASDVLLRVLGGADKVQSYLLQIGINDMRVVNTEKEIGRDWKTQFENWSTPLAAVELLRAVDRGDANEVDDHLDDNGRTIYQFMIDSVTGPRRLKGLLPKGAVVAHKTGTGGTRSGVNSATNDIGLVTLPNGNHLAIAVFVADSPADEKTREAVIARIARAAWDRFIN
ncbi:MAG: class A beta-lactamase [Pyrinomonadaceae bacterium]